MATGLDVATRLGIQSETENDWVCPCPSHDDQDASLTVKKSDDLAMYCLAGCSQDAVWDALANMDLVPPRRDSSSCDPIPAPTATVIPCDTGQQWFDEQFDGMLSRYALTSEDYQQQNCQFQNQIYYPALAKVPGAEPRLASVAYPIFNGKDFGWKWKSVVRVITKPFSYGDCTTGTGKRMQTVAKGVKGVFPGSSLEPDGRPLVLTGGEDKALALIKAGYRGISTSHGEGNTAEAITLIRGFGNTEIIVGMDADDAGRKDTIKAIDKCTEAGLEVRAIVWPDGLPNKWDFNDELREHGVEGIRKTIEGAVPGSEFPRQPAFEIQRFVDVVAAGIRPTEWIVKGMLTDGVNVVASPIKCGKTTIALQLAYACCTGRQFLGFDTRKSAVAWLDFDMAHSRFAEYVGRVMPQIPDNLYYSYLPKGNLFAQDGEALDSAIPPDAKLIIVDTLEKCLKAGGGRGTAYQKDVARFAGVGAWARKRGTTLFFLHHTVKDPKVKGTDLLSGSNGIGGEMDTIWVLEKPIDSPVGTLNITGRAGFAADTMTINLQKEGWIR